MKRIIISVLSAAAFTMAAQAQTAALEVSYTASSPSFKKEGVVLKNQYILLAGQDGSKFYSPRTEALDSLESTPEGKQAYTEMAKNAYFGGNMKSLPRRDGSYYVLKDMATGQLTHYDAVGTEYYSYTEPIVQMEWTVTDSTANILGYECVQAVANYNGRRWTAWFAPDVPLSNGPWKLQGLPGLILKATADGALYGFEATGIQPTSRAITPVYSTDRYRATDRMKYLKAKRSFTDNPLGQLNAKYGGSIVKVTHADGTPITDINPVKVDFLETDYR